MSSIACRPVDRTRHLRTAQPHFGRANRVFSRDRIDHGFEPPETPVMALHHGRLDLLEAHLARDRDLLTRTFDKADIYPLAWRERPLLWPRA